MILIIKVKNFLVGNWEIQKFPAYLWLYFARGGGRGKEGGSVFTNILVKLWSWCYLIYILGRIVFLLISHSFKYKIICMSNEHTRKVLMWAMSTYISRATIYFMIVNDWIIISNIQQWSTVNGYVFNSIQSYGERNLKYIFNTFIYGSLKCAPIFYLRNTCGQKEYCLFI